MAAHPAPVRERNRHAFGQTRRYASARPKPISTASPAGRSASGTLRHAEVLAFGQPRLARRPAIQGAVATRRRPRDARQTGVNRSGRRSASPQRGSPRLACRQGAGWVKTAWSAKERSVSPAPGHEERRLRASRRRLGEPGRQGRTPRNLRSRRNGRTIRESPGLPPPPRLRPRQPRRRNAAGRELSVSGSPLAAIKIGRPVSRAANTGVPADSTTGDLVLPRLRVNAGDTAWEEESSVFRTRSSRT